jgi:hypothetical protein
MTDWKNRFKAAGVHLGISLLIAVLSALLVLGVWYPYPYREISGGRELFLLVVAVDVVLGPVITLIVFNRAKPVRELVRDLAVVGLIQLAGLGYGLWSVSEARPVHLVFEIDRFRVVHAFELSTNELLKTPSGIQALPLTGPTLLAVRPFVSENEKSDVTMVALMGINPSSRPDFWHPYNKATQRVLAAAHPFRQLQTRFSDKADLLSQVLAETGKPADELVYLPLAARKSFWTVVLDARTAQVLVFLPLDSF